MTTQLVYKAVRRGTDRLDRDIYCSAVTDERDWMLYYRLDEMTHPIVPISYIFAFDTKQHALSFAIHNGFRWQAAIMKCLAEVVPVRGWPRFCALEQHTYLEWWEDQSGGMSLMSPTCPLGTIWCRWVLPKKIWWWFADSMKLRERRVRSDKLVSL